MVDIKFHSDESCNFIDSFTARGFVYTDYSIEMHNHDFYEVNVILSGSGTHCIEHGSYRVKAGDVFVIPPNVAHAYKDTEKLDVYHILLKRSFIEQYRKEAEQVKGFLQLVEIEPFLRSNYSEGYFLQLSQYQLLQFKNEKEFIDDDGDFPWEKCAQLKYHTILKILYWFSDLLIKQNERLSGKTAVKYELQIINSLEYIHTNYYDKITIDTLCEKAFLSRSTFLRSFGSVCGLSPIEYLNNYRCKKALELMENSALSKTEIAHSCGFYDLSHMERMIKKYRILDFRS